MNWGNSCCCGTNDEIGSGLELRVSYFLLNLENGYDCIFVLKMESWRQILMGKGCEYALFIEMVINEKHNSKSHQTKPNCLIYYGRSRY
jgi:hypothetical protein